MSVDGLRKSRRGELVKELVGSHPSQDRLYHWFKSNDYGRILSDNNAYIKDKRMVCLSYRSEFEVIRNFCVPQWSSVLYLNVEPKVQLPFGLLACFFEE